MDLVSIYNEYSSYHKEYVSFIEELLNSDLTAYNSEIIIERLDNAFKTFERFNSESEDIKVEESDMNNFKDLKYLLIDSLLLSSELSNFYKHDELMRFKMRINNYINKLRRNEIFKESSDSSCRVEF